jgi:hypothetical protein
VTWVARRNRAERPASRATRLPSCVGYAQPHGKRRGGQQEQRAGHAEPMPQERVERQGRRGGETARQPEDEREPDEQEHAGKRSGDTQVVDPRHGRQLRPAVPEDRHGGAVGDRVHRHQDQVVADDRAGEPDGDADGVVRQQLGRGVSGEREAADHGEQMKRPRAVPAQEPAGVKPAQEPAHVTASEQPAQVRQLEGPAHVRSGRSGWRPTWCCAPRGSRAGSPGPGSRGPV